MEQPAHPSHPVNPSAFLRLKGWLNDVVNFCYPTLCASCRSFCPDGRDLCTNCGSLLDALATVPACVLCGLSLAYPNAPCPNCIGRGVAHYESVTRLGSFDLPLRSLIHQFKYHRHWEIGEFLADRMLKEDHIEALLLKADCLLPVPLHGLRQVSRGFNQAEVIARRLARTTGLPIVSPAVRCRSTDMQTHLHSRAQRMKNLKGAFKLIDPDEITGQTVVVIDDVMTTGATLQCLVRALKPARPAAMHTLVVATANPKTQGGSEK